MNFLEDVLSGPYILYAGLLINIIAFFITLKNKKIRGFFTGGIFYFIFLIIVVHFGNEITAFSEYSGNNIFLYVLSGIVTIIFGSLIICASFSVFGVFPFTFALGIVGIIEGIKFLVKKTIQNKEEGEMHVRNN